MAVVNKLTNPGKTLAWIGELDRSGFYSLLGIEGIDVMRFPDSMSAMDGIPKRGFPLVISEYKVSPGGIALPSDLAVADNRRIAAYTLKRVYELNGARIPTLITHLGDIREADFTDLAGLSRGDFVDIHNSGHIWVDLRDAVRRYIPKSVK